MVRRYKDFEWLYEILTRKYPFRAVPLIPKKTINRRARQEVVLSFAVVAASADFMASRRRGLEEFLFLIMNHPVISEEVVVGEFLSAVGCCGLRGVMRSW